MLFLDGMWCANPGFLGVGGYGGPSELEAMLGERNAEDGHGEVPPVVVILPLPVEQTTSYWKGTSAAPAAILEASRQVELFDLELGCSLEELSFFTLSPPPPDHGSIRAQLEVVEACAERVCGARTFVVGLGGEHTVTLPLVQGVCKKRELAPDEVGVVQIDAHADLRPDYEGTSLSHACVMRRIVERGHPVAQFGVRAADREEALFAEAHPRVSQVTAISLRRGDARSLVRDALRNLPRKLYLSVDLDGLDPSLVPAVGTPEPGGLNWEEFDMILEEVAAHGEVVGADVVELCPAAAPGPLSPFVAARVVARLLARLLLEGRRGA